VAHVEEISKSKKGGIIVKEGGGGQRSAS